VRSSLIISYTYIIIASLQTEDSQVTTAQSRISAQRSARSSSLSHSSIIRDCNPEVSFGLYVDLKEQDVVRTLSQIQLPDRAIPSLQYFEDSRHRISIMLSLICFTFFVSSSKTDTPRITTLTNISSSTLDVNILSSGNNKRVFNDDSN
jgi:hypothetical protein